MNLKVQLFEPQPPPLTDPCLITFLSEPHSLLMIYAPPVPQQKAEEPKKKFTFKAKETPVNTTEPIHLFDQHNNRWVTKQSKGKFPSKRQNSGHACLGPCLLVYGGKQITPSKQLNDLYALNLTTWQWKKIFTMEAPPVHPNPVIVALNADRLAVLQDDVWLFNARDINWQAEATDLPGGIWQKLNIKLPLVPLCGCLHEQQLIVFGKNQGLSVCMIDLQENNAIKLSVENQACTQFETVEICVTSQQKGLMFNQKTFASFNITGQKLYLSQTIQVEEMISQLTTSAPERLNYALNSNKQLLTLVFTVPEGQQEFPDTSRQIITQNPHHSSFIEKDPEQCSSRQPESPPFSTESANSPILNKLSPLLAREWLRRRVLEQKGKLLEETIKKAERMVLALCRYGNETQKQRHISHVCMLRQNLCKVLQSQNFIRREMSDRPGQDDLRNRSLRQVHGEDVFDLSQF